MSQSVNRSFSRTAPGLSPNVNKCSSKFLNIVYCSPQLIVVTVVNTVPAQFWPKIGAFLPFSPRRLRRRKAMQIIPSVSVAHDDFQTHIRRDDNFFELMGLIGKQILLGSQWFPYQIGSHSRSQRGLLFEIAPFLFIVVHGILLLFC